MQFQYVLLLNFSIKVNHFSFVVIYLIKPSTKDFLLLNFTVKHTVYFLKHWSQNVNKYQ